MSSSCHKFVGRTGTADLPIEESPNGKPQVVNATLGFYVACRPARRDGLRLKTRMTPSQLLDFSMFEDSNNCISHHPYWLGGQRENPSRPFIGEFVFMPRPPVKNIQKPCHLLTMPLPLAVPPSVLLAVPLPTALEHGNEWPYGLQMLSHHKDKPLYMTCV